MSNQYKTNALGHNVPVELIKPIDLIRDELVMSIIGSAREMRLSLSLFKSDAISEINNFVDLSSAEHGINYGGTKGNITLTSFDGRYQIKKAIGEHRVFDEQIQAAKALIDECIGRWSDGANANLRALVDHAFRVNKQGRIDVNQVLSLRQLNIDELQWLQAMDAITDAIKISGTSQYLRIYERRGDGKYEQISLDIAGV